MSEFSNYFFFSLFENSETLKSSIVLLPVEETFKNWIAMFNAGIQGPRALELERVGGQFPPNDLKNNREVTCQSLPARVQLAHLLGTYYAPLVFQRSQFSSSA